MRARHLLTLSLIVAGCGTADTPSTTVASTDAASVTTSPVESAPPTTSPVESAPPTTSPATTGAVTTSPVGEQMCPEVIDVEFRETGPGVFTVSATVRSEDIEGVSFADAWEVRDLDGTVLGTRILAHAHANEQPFTRSLGDVAIPGEVTEVEVAARDSVRGFCGASLTVAVPHS